jgi:ABC-type transport system involved in cytochrome bd biosynthesis fused ATPase/permease subunit
MRLSDLTDIDRASNIFIKLIGALFAVILLGAMVREALGCLSLMGALVLITFFLCASPVAYLIRESRRQSRPERPRGGAERTPVLPPTEDEE